LAVTSSQPANTGRLSSVNQLNEYLTKTLGLTYSGERNQTLKIVVGSVVAGPDGRRVSACLSKETTISAGARLRLPAACETGGFVSSETAEVIANTNLGKAIVINHEEQYFTDMRPLNWLEKDAVDQARRLGSAVLVIGGFPVVTRETSVGIEIRAMGYPCVKY
jgi:hypothetical protein